MKGSYYNIEVYSIKIDEEKECHRSTSRSYYSFSPEDVIQENSFVVAPRVSKVGPVNS